MKAPVPACFLVYARFFIKRPPTRYQSEPTADRGPQRRGAFRAVIPSRSHPDIGSTASRTAGCVADNLDSTLDCKNVILSFKAFIPGVKDSIPNVKDSISGVKALFSKTSSAASNGVFAS